MFYLFIIYYPDKSYHKDYLLKRLWSYTFFMTMTSLRFYSSASPKIYLFSTTTIPQYFSNCIKLKNTIFRSSDTEVFLSKRYSEIIQQIYERTPLPKCDFVAKQYFSTNEMFSRTELLTLYKASFLRCRWLKLLQSNLQCIEFILVYRARNCCRLCQKSHNRNLNVFWGMACRLLLRTTYASSCEAYVRVAWSNQF